MRDFSKNFMRKAASFQLIYFLFFFGGNTAKLAIMHSYMTDYWPI